MATAALCILEPILDAACAGSNGQQGNYCRRQASIFWVLKMRFLFVCAAAICMMSCSPADQHKADERAREAGRELKREAQRASEEIKHGAEELNRKARPKLDEAGREIKEETHRAAEKVRETADRTRNKVEGHTKK